MPPAEPPPGIVLASASARRRDLLERAGLSFTIEVAGVSEELPPDIDPETAARVLAERKARAVAERTASATPVCVVGADTVVAVPSGDGWTLCGKPADADEARAMLSMLSDTTHSVITGVCVIRDDGTAETAAETTHVTMRPLAPGEVEAYVASEEWRDKAGGYAIQENADAFVTRLEEGGFDNVVGLPVALTLDLLRRAGAL